MNFRLLAPAPLAALLGLTGCRSPSAEGSAAGPAARPSAASFARHSAGARPAPDAGLGRFLAAHPRNFACPTNAGIVYCGLGGAGADVHLYHRGTQHGFDLELYSESYLKYKLLRGGVAVGYFMYEPDFEEANRCHVAIDDARLVKRLGGFEQGEFLALAPRPAPR